MAGTMIERHPGRPAVVVAVAALGAALAAPPPAQPQPGPAIGVVQEVQKGAFRIDLDPASGVFPGQLQGQRVVVRRLLKEVYLLQSYRRLVAEWQEVGVGRVLPIARTGGAPLALLLWQDEKSPVRAGDRVELCRAPLDLLRPQIDGPRCRPLLRPEVETTTVAPGETVWVEAAVVCPTGEQPPCKWEADAGEFVHAGGWSAGPRLEAGSIVRWRAPTAAEDGTKATIKLLVESRWAAVSNEGRVEVTVRAPRGQYAPAQLLRTTFDGKAPFGEARAIAAGPLGSFYLADAAARRLVHWGPRNTTFLALGKGAVAALGGGEDAWLVAGAGLMRWAPEAREPTAVADLPRGGRMAGLGFTAAGDAALLDNSAPVRLHVLEGRAWKSVELGLQADSPFLNAFTLDPLTNDLFVADGRDKVLRWWRALTDGGYRTAACSIILGKEIDRLGKPVAVLPRRWCDRVNDLPVSVVFERGGITKRWVASGDPLVWRPESTARPREFVGMNFTARCAATLPDGDLILGGTTRAEGAEAAAVVELSPQGELRRMLPVPQMPPRGVAATPDGRCFLLLVQPRWGADLQRVVLLGPQGWVVRDLGELAAIEDLTRIRADRASPDRCFVVGRKKKRRSAFRLDAADPSRTVELSYAQILRGSVPEHEAVDVGSSPDHIAVLADDGRVLVFSNTRPIAYLGEFKTGLRHPRAIAVFSNMPAGAAGGGRQSFACILPSGREARSLHIWRFNAQPGSKLVAVKVGVFPDPGTSLKDALLSSPLALATGFPDQPGRLYVLDRGGARVRAFDVADLAFKLARGEKPKAVATVLLSGLPSKGEALDMSVGPGQVIYVADPEGQAVHVFRRAP